MPPSPRVAGPSPGAGNLLAGGSRS